MQVVNGAFTLYNFNLVAGNMYSLIKGQCFQPVGLPQVCSGGDGA